MLENYKDLEVLGQGSFGTVMRVQRKSDGKVFARKSINHSAFHPKFKQGIYNEAKVLAGVKHPNIVAFVESFEHGQTLHIVMDYYERGDLANWISRVASRGETINARNIWSIIDQIILGLFRCHNGFNHPQDPAGPGDSGGIRVLHRDLKPENIFLDMYGVIKLGDFGVCATFNQAEEMRATFAGTPLYMPPELIDAQDYTIKSETWALGCILHELTTLKPTFFVEGTGIDETRDRIMRGIYDPVPEMYGRAMRDLVKNCLAFNPASRPDMGELANNPYIVEARGQRLQEQHQRQWQERIDWENHLKEQQYRQREQAILEREAALEKHLRLEGLLAERKAAVAIREITVAGREAAVEQREAAITENELKFQAETRRLHERELKIQEDQRVIKQVQTRIEKEYEARLAMIKKQEQRVQDNERAFGSKKQETEMALAAEKAELELRASQQKEEAEKLAAVGSGLRIEIKVATNSGNPATTLQISGSQDLKLDARELSCMQKEVDLARREGFLAGMQNSQKAITLATPGVPPTGMQNLQKAITLTAHGVPSTSGASSFQSRETEHGGTMKKKVKAKAKGKGKGKEKDETEKDEEMLDADAVKQKSIKRRAETSPSPDTEDRLTKTGETSNDAQNPMPRYKNGKKARPSVKNAKASTTASTAEKET